MKFSKYRWVIESLLAVGRHFQKTSYDKEVDGEKQVIQYPLQIEESSFTNAMQVVQLDEHPGIEEKLCRCVELKKRKKKLAILSPQPLGHFSGGRCQRLLPRVWSLGHICRAIQQSQPQVWRIFPANLCLNPFSFRVKEIAVGIMSNMLCHEKVFLGIVDKQRYLNEK